MALAQTTNTPDSEEIQAVQAKSSLLQRDGVLAWLFMIPGWSILLLFMAYPFFLGIWLSLTDKMLGFSKYDYIGLQNYRDLWTDSIFQQTLRNTAIYGVGTVPFKLLFGLGLALLLNRQFRFSRYFRAGLLLPWIVPTALSSLAWLMLFSAVISPISLVLKQWGLIDHNINFLGDPWNARISLCIANIWRGVPFFAISILAGLQAVPVELVEAAALDGASRWDRFRAVVFPGHQTDRIDHHPLFGHLDHFGFPARLCIDQRRTSQRDPCARYLRLSDRHERHRDRTGRRHLALYVPSAGPGRHPAVAFIAKR